MGAAVTLGRYRLLRSLGRGGMGVVHLALAQGPVGFEKLVALKLLDPKFRGDPRRSEGLLREALVGGRLDHEHLVQILDLGQEVDQYFIAMEYVRGFSLSHVLAHLRHTGRQLPIYLAVRIVRAVNDALVYMHGLTFGNDQPLGLVHGDISPSNILLGADGRVKLSDLGVVALSGEVRSHIAGKTAYFPPEAFRGVPRTQIWDVYALGAVLFEALTGRRLSQETVALDDTEPAAQRPSPLVSDLRPDCPPELVRVVERVTAHAPEQRIRHATALAEALDAAAPETAGERDRHRSYLSALYAEGDFVRDHGELPSESGVPADLVPKVAEEETEQVTARGLRGERVLRLGISPAHGSVRARASGERLAQELSRRLSRPVRTVVLGDYEALVESLTASDLDLAWMPPLALVGALDRGAGVLAVASRAGASLYNAAVIVHADSPLRALEDVPLGATVAYVDERSASGHVFAVAGMVRVLGAERVRSLRPNFHGSHRAVCEAVANRWVDLGATYAVVRAGGQITKAAWPELLPERAGEIRVLWMSDAIPSDCMAHRPHLPERVATAVREALLGMASEPEGAALLRDVFGADSFVRGQPDDYEPARVARALVADALR